MEQEKISSAQIRGARGLLGWSQAKLAEEAKVSSMTVKRAEGSGTPYPASQAISKIKKALERAQVVFIPENGGGAGVRLAKK